MPALLECEHPDRVWAAGVRGVRGGRPWGSAVGWVRRRRGGAALGLPRVWGWVRL